MVLCLNDLRVNTIFHKVYTLLRTEDDHFW